MEEIQKKIRCAEKNSRIYPAKLREISGMPERLYYIGRFPENDRPSAAIVGARLCSTYGRIQAFRYGKFLSEHGVQVIVHHSDSFAATLVPYMIDMGIDIWQGVMNSNNIPELIKQYGGQISFMGGIESAKVDYPGWTMEDVERETAKACQENGKLYYIPGTTIGGPMSIFPGVYQAVSEEIDKQSKICFK